MHIRSDTESESETNIKRLVWETEDHQNILSMYCEFVKSYDNTFHSEYMEYAKEELCWEEGERPPFLSMVGFEESEIGFDHPLYPYTQYFLLEDNRDSIALFRYISLDKLVVNGRNELTQYTIDLIRTVFHKNSFSHFYLHTLNNTRYILIPNETLLWVNLRRIKN